MSVSELRQWLAGVSEQHQNHFRKGQISKRTAPHKENLHQPDSRENKSPPTPESKSSTVFKETPQQERGADGGRKASNQGVPSRRVVSYASEHPAWHFRKIQKEKGRLSSIDEFNSNDDAMVADNSSRKLEDTVRDTSRGGNKARKSSGATVESDKRFTTLDHSNPEETITFHRKSYDSTTAHSPNAFPTANSTLFSDCFAEQMDLKDHWVTKREERPSGKSRLVQDRQRALQEKWAQDRQTVHKKKVQWTTLKGSYKKTIVLTEEGEI